jgi:TctA family transporter
MPRLREFYVSILAIASGAGVLFLMRKVPWGTLERIGPAALPGIIAIALVAAGVWHALRTVALPSPQRQARQGYSWLDLLPWAVLAALLVTVLWLRPTGLMLRMGPPEYAMAWLLVLSLVFGASWLAERGALSRLAIPILLGLLMALGDVDLSSGITRWWELEPGFAHGVLAGALIVALRLPVASFVVGFSLAVQIEEQLRRSLLLSRGSPDIFVTRPWSAAFLGIALVIIVAVLFGRFRGRRHR